MKIALGILIALACCMQPAFAVRPGQPTSTAEWVCLYRAIAAQHPRERLDLSHQTIKSRILRDRSIELDSKLKSFC